MSDPLATYLIDHLAGSNFAIELLENLREQHAGEPVGEFAAAELAPIREDHQLLRRIMDRVGAEPSAIKTAGTWVAEKLSRFKLTHAASGEFGVFEALEMLSLGIMGRVALWRVLATLAPADDRLRGPDFEALAAAAKAQHERVDERRLQLAATAFHATA